MKAEERKHLKENELAERLGGIWRTIASGSTTNTIIWGVILVALALAIGWRYYSRNALNTRSAEWSTIERAGSNDEFKQIIKEHPGTVVARVAKYHLTRREMENALLRVASPTSDDRVKAADELIGTRDRYAELVKETPREEPELIQEAMMGVAKAEEVLAAIPKADNPVEPRGSLDVAQKAYEELAKRYPDTYFGKQADARAKELAEHKFQIRAFYNELMEAHGKPVITPPFPALPSAPPAPSADAPKPVDPKDVPPLPSVPPANDKPTATPTPPASGSPAAPPKEEPKPKGP